MKIRTEYEQLIDGFMSKGVEWDTYYSTDEGKAYPSRITTKDRIYWFKPDGTSDPVTEQFMEWSNGFAE